MGFNIQPYGIQSMLKEGHKHLTGLDEAVLKNIDACKQLSTITRTSLGPNGMNKMVINHLDKLFVFRSRCISYRTFKNIYANDAVNQDSMHYHITLSCLIVVDYSLSLIDLSLNVILPFSLPSNFFFACIQVCPKNPANFNVDNVRVAKLLGGGLHNSTVVRGMVLKSDAVGTIKHAEKAKVAVFAGGVDTSATETKGTVLIHTAEQIGGDSPERRGDSQRCRAERRGDARRCRTKEVRRAEEVRRAKELENYSKTEEAKVEELIKAVADSGAKVIVSGGSVGEMALHFCERYKLMVLKISSKFELRRFCRTTGSIAMLKLGQPNPDDLGYVDSVSVEEIGGVRVIVVKNEEGGNSVATVVLRGSTDSILDDLERAVDDGVNTYKAMCRDSRIVPGAAATEIELAKRVKDFSFKETGLDQYAIAKFAESFEMIPRTLAENAGLNAMEIISSLYAEHASGNVKVGIDLEEGVCKDVSTLSIWDLHVTKFFALKYAADAACTVLRVDQIIMSKPAGGPRREQPAGMDED
uniref:T-complex protein 1 subunit theta n=1 Tax=Cajanus cajan TaxID=3821 RepID=A0A151T5P4_CAJCA|nr:T-complex protein 1 subunit theta [Cajanus cajan]